MEGPSGIHLGFLLVGVSFLSAYLSLGLLDFLTNTDTFATATFRLSLSAVASSCIAAI